MNKNKIMSIGLFAILSLSFIPVVINQSVYAQEYTLSKITGFSENIIEVDYVEGTNILWVLTGEVDGSFFISRLVSVDVTTQNIIDTTIVFNDTATDHRTSDLDCSEQYCNFSVMDHQADGSELGSIRRVDISAGDGTAIAPTSADILDATVKYSTPQNVGTIILSEVGQLGGVTVYGGLHRGDATATDYLWTRFDALFLNWSDTNFTPLEESALSGPGVERTVYELDLSGNPSPDNFIAGIGKRAGSDVGILFVYDLDEGSQECVTAEADTFFTAGSGLIVDTIDLEFFYTSTGSGVIEAWSIEDCTNQYTISATDTGLSNTIFAMEIVLINNEKFLVARDSGVSGAVSFMPWNGTHFTENELIIDTLAGSSQGLTGIGVNVDINPNIGKIRTGFDVDSLFIPMTNTDRAVTVIEFDSLGAEEVVGEEVTGIDCSLPENLNILICRLTSTTSGNIGGLGGILDTGLFSLFTNSGIIDGTDTDPKTNGIGYFITIAGFGVMTAMFFIATKGRLNDVPTFIWMLSAIALLGAITAIGWLEPTFLIIGIISIVALAAMQIRNTIDRGIDFGGRGDF